MATETHKHFIKTSPSQIQPHHSHQHKLYTNISLYQPFQPPQLDLHSGIPRTSDKYMYTTERKDIIPTGLVVVGLGSDLFFLSFIVHRNDFLPYDLGVCTILYNYEESVEEAVRCSMRLSTDVHMIVVMQVPIYYAIPRSDQ